MQRHWAICCFVTFLLFTMVPAMAQQPKPFASGVVKTIPSNLDPRDSYSLPMPLPKLSATDYDPVFLPKKDTLYGQSRRVVMFRDVWEYEFSFLGLRQAKLLVPDEKTGSSELQNVWYLIYRIRNQGKTLSYEQVKQSPDFDHIKYDLRRDKPLSAETKFFLPRFTLEGWVISNSNDGYQKVAYRDRVSPMVLRQIQRREDPALNLLDSVTMSQTNIPLAQNDADPGVWGVAIFENVDPRIDFVSVFVKGLTNAFRIGRDPGNSSRAKTLQLNFSRLGDTVDEEDDTIEYGIPLVDNPQQQVLICRRFDLPGPLIRIYHVNKLAANRNVLVAEADANVSLDDFQSKLTPILDQGKLPPSVSQAIADSGISVNKQAAVQTLVPGKRWQFKEGEDEYILALEPQFWERDRDGIRFLRSLDHLWIYR